MKKTLLILALLALWLCPTAFATSKYIVIDDNINVRLDSTINSPSLGYLSKDEMVEVLEEKFGWYKIKLPKKFNCYISQDYVQRTGPGRVKVTASKVNLRKDPSLKSPILGQVAKDTILFSRGDINEWVRVQGYPHTKGWVHTKFLQKYDKEVEQ